MPVVQHRQPIANKQPLTGKKSGSTAVIVVVVIVVLGAIAAAGWFFYPELFTFIKKTPPPPPTEAVDTTPVVTAVPDTIEEAPLNTVAAVETPSEEAMPPLRYDSSSNIEKGFYLIVGSFKNKTNARRFAKKLQDDVDTKVLYFEKSELYRVTTGRYSYLNKAWNDLKAIRSLAGCEQAWIVENR